MKQHLWYLAIGALSFLAVTILERLATGLEGYVLRTEIYSIHGFSHVLFGIGLASIILFLRPKASARLVILGVLLAGIAWELHEGFWLRGEPIDSGRCGAGDPFCFSVSMFHKKKGQGGAARSPKNPERFDECECVCFGSCNIASLMTRRIEVQLGRPRKRVL